MSDTKKKDNDTLFKGLTAAEAEKSRREHGSNSLTKKKRKGFFKQFLASFGDPIIKILLIALAVNIIFMLRDFNWYETAGIAFAVLLATLVSTLSEYGSESAFEKLQQEAAGIKCRVLRNGSVAEIAIDEIVAGDIVYLQAGERVPADGAIVEGEISVDQSALNGETKEALKFPSPKMFERNDLLAENMAFRGSVVCEGEGVMRVSRVGDATFYGSLALEIQEETAISPLKLRLTHLAQAISVFGYAAAIVVVLANLFNNIVIDNYFEPVLIMEYLSDTTRLLRDVLRAVTLGITVIVMAVPEGLPMMITVVLSANMRRMMKDNVLVRKLVGIETSGSLNILFTDKTGTLTEGKLSVQSFVSGTGTEIPLSRLGSHGNLHELVMLNCTFNNGAQMSGSHALGGNSTDRALLEFAAGGLTDCAYKKGWYVPFNSKDKFSAVEIIGKRRIFMVKGAPENLIPKCVNVCDEYGERRPLAGKSAVNRLLRTVDALACEYRTLALCAADNEADAKSLKNLTLIGILGIRDEIRTEVRGAIEQVTNAGVQVVMVTGDNRRTAESVALKAGLLKAGGKIMTSTELNKLSDNQVKELLPELRVIARALPSDKSRLVRLSQELGLVAGMTGDGVNDAPALKKSDVGFAMGDGTEIAKEAGDIVILDNNFASIVKAILYGRTIFKSIRKFIIFQLTINICAVGVSVIGPFIGIETPVTVIQMLWINMIMDTLAGLAYAGEAPLPEYMNEPPKKRAETIINKYMYSQIICTGVYTTFLCLVFFKLPFIQIFLRGEEKYLLTAFFGLFVFTGVFNSLNARTYRVNIFSYILKNKAFLVIMSAVFLIQMGLLYYGGALFRTAGLRLGELALVLAFAVTVVLFDLARKVILRAYNRKGFI